MKLRLGKIPINNSFIETEKNWKQIKEPSALLSQIIGILFGFIYTGFIFWLIKWKFPNQAFNFDIIDFVLFIILIIPLHELIHASIFPGSLSSDDLIIGFWPKLLAFYAHYEGEMTRVRFQMVLLAPFLFLTIIPLLFILLTGLHIKIIITLLLLNSLASCVDVLGVFILFQISSKKIVRNSGPKTFYRVDSI